MNRDQKKLFLFALYLTSMVLVNTLGSEDYHARYGKGLRRGIFHADPLSCDRHRGRSLRQENFHAICKHVHHHACVHVRDDGIVHRTPCESHLGPTGILCHDIRFQHAHDRCKPHQLLHSTACRCVCFLHHQASHQREASLDQEQREYHCEPIHRHHDLQCS